MKRQGKSSTRRDLQLPKLRVQGQFAPETMNAEARTVDIRWYTGATVRRVPLFDEPFNLSFSLDPRAVRMGRLESGNAPFTMGHIDASHVDGVLGVIERAWLDKDGGHATVRFSNRPEVQSILADVRDGILRNVSMDASVFELDDVTQESDELTHLQATDWEPLAVALVAIGADPMAVTLADENVTSPCTVTLRAEALAEAPNGATAPNTKGNVMKVRETATGKIIDIEDSEFDAALHSEELSMEAKGIETPKPRRTSDPIDAQRKVDDELARQEKLAVEVRRVASRFGLDPVWAQRHIALGTDIEDVMTSAADERAKRAPKIAGDISMGEDYDSIQFRGEQMAEALAARATRRDPPEAAKQYARASFADVALEVLGMARNPQASLLHPRADQQRIFELALHSTSDFPLILANALNKVLLPAYQNAAPSYRRIASQRSFNDFRPHNFIRGGDFPDLALVGENGEYTRGTLSENSEAVTAATYGRVLGLSRQMLVNDDAGAFANIAAAAGRRVSDFENALFYKNVINANAGLGPNLSDGLPVYSLPAHGNVTPQGVLDNTRLSAAVQLMLQQTSTDGLKLNVQPSILLVSPASITLARTLLTAVQATQASLVNPFAGQMEAIVDANLTGTRFYALADPGTLPNYVYGYLGNATGPRTEVRNGFDVDGVEFKVSLDFGVGAIDYRGGVVGAGA